MEEHRETKVKRPSEVAHFLRRFELVDRAEAVNCLLLLGLERYRDMAGGGGATISALQQASVRSRRPSSMIVQDGNRRPETTTSVKRTPSRAPPVAFFCALPSSKRSTSAPARPPVAATQSLGTTNERPSRANLHQFLAEQRKELHRAEFSERENSPKQKQQDLPVTVLTKSYGTTTNPPPPVANSPAKPTPALDFVFDNAEPTASNPTGDHDEDDSIVPMLRGTPPPPNGVTRLPKANGYENATPSFFSLDFIRALQSHVRDAAGSRMSRTKLCGALPSFTDEILREEFEPLYKSVLIAFHISASF
jgi:hypothetical protein